VFDVPSYRIGKIFGIPIEVNASWIVIFALVSLTLGAGYYPSLPETSAAPRLLMAVVGILTAALFFTSIVVHELAHALVTRAFGGHVNRITLFMFGGVAELADEPTSPGKEFLMAGAGPLMSLGLAVVLFVAYLVAAARGASWWLWAPLQYLATINLFIGVFNLLPGFPLDGGRLLRAALWGLTGDLLKATRWASRSGQLIGWALVTYAVLVVINVIPGASDAIWLGLIGWFIVWLAGSSYRQQEVRSRLAAITVGSIMTPHPHTVVGEQTVEQLAHDHFLGGDHSRYPVVFEGSVHGLVSLADIKAVGRADWPYVRVIDVTNRDLAALTVWTDTPVVTLLPRLAGENPGALLVVGEGRLVGIVTRADVISALQHE
jgi:Zn-dependent protease/predicted transcriptional regulator